MSSAATPVRINLLERLLGTSNYNVVLAICANVISWVVATLMPSQLPRLLPFIPEEDDGTDLARAVPNGALDRSRTRCVAVGRPGGMEQLRIITLKEGYVTCGYNVPGYDRPFVDVSDPRKIPTRDAATPLVVLRVHAFSINYADCCIRWGLYESANRFVGYPIVPGFDVAGVVERVIPAAVAAAEAPPPFAVGDRVYGATFFGAYSTRCLIPAHQLRRIPAGVSFARAAALPAVSLTALYALHLGGRFSATTDRDARRDDDGGGEGASAAIAPRNRSILIHSAAGGVGSMLVQMAKLLGLSPVVGVVGRTAKVDEARSLGCDVVVDKQRLGTDATPLWEAIAAAGPPDGFSIIADPNGVATLRDSFDHLCPAGRLVAYGFHSNLPMGRDALHPLEWARLVRKALQMPSFDPMELVTSNRSVLGFNLSFFVNEMEMLGAMYDQIERWLTDEKGGLRCPRVTEMAMDDIGEAHRLIQSGKTVGKLVMIAAGETQQ